MKKPLLRALRFLTAGYVLLCLCVAGCQSKLLYHPRVTAEPVLLAAAGERGVAGWRDSSGMLTGWHIPNASARARLLVFHGNAIDAVERSHYIRTFNAAGFETFVMEYPGYGARPGSPGREAFYSAARAAIAELKRNDKRPLYLLGESIGSGTACAMAGEMPGEIAGVILTVPFARLADVAQKAFPVIPVRLLLRDAYDNIAALKTYNGPLVVMVAAEDEIVGVDQGRLVYTTYSGPKRLIELEGTSHNTFNVAPDEPWVISATRFLETGR